jgi:hypothetical protein
MFNAVEKGFSSSGDTDTAFINGQLASLYVVIPHLLTPMLSRGTGKEGPDGYGKWHVRTLFFNEALL